MNNKDVKVGRVRERLAALHGSQFMAEISVFFFLSNHYVSVLARIESTVLLQAGNRGLNMQAASLD